MRICRHCRVRVELVECADGHDRWMHVIGADVPGIPANQRTMYLECKPTLTVADPG